MTPGSAVATCPLVRGPPARGGRGRNGSTRACRAADWSLRLRSAARPTTAQASALAPGTPEVARSDGSSGWAEDVDDGEDVGGRDTRHLGRSMAEQDGVAAASAGSRRGPVSTPGRGVSDEPHRGRPGEVARHRATATPHPHRCPRSRARQPCRDGLEQVVLPHRGERRVRYPCSANSTVTRSGSVDMTTPSPHSGWRTLVRESSPSSAAAESSAGSAARAVPASQLSQCPHGSTTCSRSSPAAAGAGSRWSRRSRASSRSATAPRPAAARRSPPPAPPPRRPPSPTGAGIRPGA